MCHSSLIWQNRLQSKTNEKRSRRTHHSNQGKNSPRWHYYCKYIPNSGTPNFIFKENVLLDAMIHNDRDLWLVVDFNDPLSLNGTLCTKIKQKNNRSNAICQMYSTLLHASTQRGFSAAYRGVCKTENILRALILNKISTSNWSLKASWVIES